MRPVDDYIKDQLTQGLSDIGAMLSTDIVTIISPNVPGLELRLRQAIESIKSPEEAVSVIFDTPGGR